jgi:hypothetical protein
MEHFQFHMKYHRWGFLSRFVLIFSVFFDVKVEYLQLLVLVFVYISSSGSKLITIEIKLLLSESVMIVNIYRY